LTANNRKAGNGGIFVFARQPILKIIPKRNIVLSTDLFKLAKVSCGTTFFLTAYAATYFSFIDAIPDIPLVQVVVERWIRFIEDPKQIR